MRKIILMLALVAGNVQADNLYFTGFTTNTVSGFRGYAEFNDQCRLRLEPKRFRSRVARMSELPQMIYGARGSDARKSTHRGNQRGYTAWIVDDVSNSRQRNCGLAHDTETLTGTLLVVQTGTNGAGWSIRTNVSCSERHRVACVESR